MRDKGASADGCPIKADLGRTGMSVHGQVPGSSGASVDQSPYDDIGDIGDAIYRMSIRAPAF